MTAVPDSVKRSIAYMAEGAIVNAEGGFGAQELQWALEGLAENLTSLCKDYSIFYRAEPRYITIEDKEVGTYEDLEFFIYSNEQWPIWEKNAS